jgi:hypothetical protein
MGTSAALLNETGAVIVSFQKCENPLSRGNCFDVSIQKGMSQAATTCAPNAALVETTSHGTVLCGYTPNASGSGARMHWRHEETPQHHAAPHCAVLLS